MWNDITTYSQGDKERKPAVFENKCGDLRIVIMNSHINYRGDWVMHCRVLGIDTLHLKTCKTQADAEKRAIEIVRMKVGNLVESINLLTSNKQAGEIK